MGSKTTMPKSTKKGKKCKACRKKYDLIEANDKWYCWYCGEVYRKNNKK